MIGKSQTFFNGRARTFGQLTGVAGVRFRQQHSQRVVAVARYPVVPAKKRPQQNAHAFENPAADAVTEALVEFTQMIDVEQHQRERTTKPAGTFCFLGEHRIEHGSGMKRRQGIGDRGSGRTQVDSLHERCEARERSAANHLRDGRPVFAGCAERLVESQFIERTAFGQRGEREQLVDVERPFEDGRPEAPDRGAPRLIGGTQQRRGQRVDQNAAKPDAVSIVERSGDVLRKDRCGIRRDH